MSILVWPEALRVAGLSVYERPGWRTNQPLGPLRGLNKIYWHHDASPVGNSPGAWDWITSSYDTKQPSAQLWMDYDGQWRFVGSGAAYHAGVTVNPSDWNTTVGLETDHTINEPYSVKMLDSLHRGFAAICRAEGRGADFVTFHKWEARPLGRKTDPYLGGDPGDTSLWAGQLANQRSIVQGIINGNVEVPFTPDIPTGGNVVPAGEDDDMFVTVQIDGQPVIYVANHVTGKMQGIPNIEQYNISVGQGLYKPVRIVNAREWDVVATSIAQAADPSNVTDRPK